MKDYSKDTTKVKLGPMVSFIRITCKNMGGEQKWLKGDHITKSPPQHEWQLTNLETHLKCTTQPTGSWTGGEVSFLGSSVSLSLF